MAIKRTYGHIYFKKNNNQFFIDDAEPHICIKLKEIFKRIPVQAVLPFKLPLTQDICHDIWWFMQRYPLKISTADNKLIVKNRQAHINKINRLEEIFLPNYKAQPITLNQGFKTREYQLSGADAIQMAERLLIGDDLGLGKSLTSLLPIVRDPAGKLPAAVVVQSHLVNQWKVAQIEKFTNLRVHIIKTVKPYTLPEADIFIFTYSKLGGWVDVFATGFFKYAIFDECQELRHRDSENYKSIKYRAALVLSNNAKACVGLSATPIYNYANEIFNVLDLIKPGCLGDMYGFIREWTSNGKIVKNPKALGTYLRENFLFLRRTRQDVGRELPPVNKLVYTVGYDHKAVEQVDKIAYELANTVLYGDFTARGQAGRQLDMYIRHMTGVSKARDVAAFVRILLENKEPVMLAGWHRDVYDIWLQELAEFNPVMYTGSETPAQKNKAADDFITGKTNLFIMSLRSGAGVDGLQKRCKHVVFGELDYSPKVHDQFIGRINRDNDGNEQQATALFLTSDFGSDPLMIDMLGLKSSQSEGLLNPLIDIPEKYSDDSRIKLLAQLYIKNKHNRN